MEVSKKCFVLLHTQTKSEFTLQPGYLRKGREEKILASISSTAILLMLNFVEDSSLIQGILKLFLSTK